MITVFIVDRKCASFEYKNAQGLKKKKSAGQRSFLDDGTITLRLPGGHPGNKVIFFTKLKKIFLLRGGGGEG